MTIERVEPALTGSDERRTLGDWLDYHRATLLRKIDGLTDAEARARSVPPSTLSLLGLVRHMADNEVWWFQAVLAGVDVPDGPYPSSAEPGGAVPDDPDADLNPPPTATVAATVPLFGAACARSRDIVAGLDSLDAVGDLRGEPVSARWVVTHMLEEYARHNGHADLLRQAIDGVTGE
jgi:hypothetical protein